MQSALGMKKETFSNKIFDWADEFNFTIDGDYIIINEDTVANFIDSLDRHFVEWGKMEEDKDGKI